MDLEG